MLWGAGFRSIVTGLPVRVPFVSNRLFQALTAEGLRVARYVRLPNGADEKRNSSRSLSVAEAASSFFSRV